MGIFFNNYFIHFRLYQNEIYRSYIIKFLIKKLIQNFSDNLYIQLYKSGYTVFKNNPLFGVGNKITEYENVIARRKIFIQNIIAQLIRIKFIFELLSEQGVFGFLIILSIIFFLHLDC